MRNAIVCRRATCFFFFFNDTATTEIYTLSLHDALPISGRRAGLTSDERQRLKQLERENVELKRANEILRSEEHTSELQSQSNLVCRLLLEKKKNKQTSTNTTRTKARWRDATIP